MFSPKFARPEIQPLFESLEERRLLSTSIDAATGLLTVKGTNQSDTIRISYVSTPTAMVHVVVNGVAEDVPFPGTTPITAIRVLGGNGGDDIAVDETTGVLPVPLTLVGGNGKDRLVGGSAADKLEGGNGVDTLVGGDGVDTLNGGNGNDEMDGGDDNDLLLGGNGKDKMKGGRGNDKMNGGDDEDTVLGEDGDDSLAGGKGRDRIKGGKGDNHTSKKDKPGEKEHGNSGRKG